MTDPKEQPRREIKAREPKKAKPDTFANLRPLPQTHPIEEIMGLAHPASADIPRPSTPSRASSPSTTIAPMRDFSKVPNSIVREVIPTGQFTGKSKQLYDYLYSLTRGAIQPRRTICLTKVRLMVGAGIGSEVTLRANLVKLKSMGLVDESVIPGTHGGNEYMVYLPEEARGSTPSRPSSDSSSTQILDPVEALESTPSRASLSAVESINSGDAKTSIKTNTTDDEDLTKFVSVIRERTRKLIGRKSQGEGERWARLATVLMDIAERSAARTETVSSMPSFMAAVLLSLSAGSERRTRRTTPALIEQPSDEAPQTLSEDLLQEQIAVFRELVSSGYPLEQIDQQFGRAFCTEEWQRIRAELESVRSS